MMMNEMHFIAFIYILWIINGKYLEIFAPGTLTKHPLWFHFDEWLLNNWSLGNYMFWLNKRYATMFFFFFLIPRARATTGQSSITTDHWLHNRLNVMFGYRLFGLLWTFKWRSWYFNSLCSYDTTHTHYCTCKLTLSQSTKCLVKCPLKLQTTIPG